METLKYITNALTQFFESLNSKTKVNTANTDDFEFTYPKFGINFNQSSDSSKAPNSLFHQMYSEENETLL